MHSLSETYREGIDKAYSEGLIEFANPDDAIAGPSPDSFTHLPFKWGLTRFGGLSSGNTHPLRPISRNFLRWVMAHRTSDIALLEIGPGAGVSAFQTWSLASDMQKPISIDTVSLSPIDPFLGLTLSRDELVELLHDRGVDAFGISPDRVLELQSEFSLDIFRVLKQPFLRHQSIGRFPDDVSVPECSYDVVMDVHGSIEHSGNPTKAFLAERRAARHDGLNYICPAYDCLREALSHDDVMIYDIDRSDDAITANRDHPLVAALAKIAPEAFATREKVFFVAGLADRLAEAA